MAKFNGIVVRSLVTGTEFKSEEVELFARIGKHVEDEIWDDGRMPRSNTEGFGPYAMITIDSLQELEEARGCQFYMLDEDGGDGGESGGVFEPVVEVVS